jgi:hypothetical protein
MRQKYAKAFRNRWLFLKAFLRAPRSRSRPLSRAHCTNERLSVLQGERRNGYEKLLERFTARACSAASHIGPDGISALAPLASNRSDAAESGAHLIGSASQPEEAGPALHLGPQSFALHIGEISRGPRRRALVDFPPTRGTHPHGEFRSHVAIVRGSCGGPATRPGGTCV